LIAPVVANPAPPGPAPSPAHSPPPSQIFQGSKGTLCLLVTLVACALMVAAWYACRKQIHEIAETRDGLTGMSPIVHNRIPLK
jgi:hypothetical protein